uniref:Candidate secreted effector n=1 Tax=Meloidogyne incognita TaxID=6306 RepID=A0A914NLQ0_MELIC
MCFNWRCVFIRAFTRGQGGLGSEGWPVLGEGWPVKRWGWGRPSCHATKCHMTKCQGTECHRQNDKLEKFLQNKILWAREVFQNQAHVH